MAIQPDEPPSAAIETVRKVVFGLASGAGFRTPNLRRANPDALTLASPHRLALLSLEEVRRGDSTETRKPALVGWRFLIQEDGRPIAAAEAAMIDAGRFKFGRLNEGPLVTGFVEAMERAARLDLPGDASFEPVLLIVPALNVAALWLDRREDGNFPLGRGDVLLPLPPTDRQLTEYEPVQPERFLSVLRDLTKRVTSNIAAGG